MALDLDLVVVLLAAATRFSMWATGRELTQSWTAMLAMEPWLRLWDGECPVLAEGEGGVATLIGWVDQVVVAVILFVMVYSLAMTLDCVVRALCCLLGAMLEKRRKSLMKSEK